MEDINDVLSSVGLVGIPANDEAVEAMEPQEEPVNVDLLNEEIDEILGNYGFPATEDNTPEPEEVIEEISEEPVGETPIEEVHEEVSVEQTVDDGSIPPNSPTLLLDDSTSRFSGTEWYNEIQKARVIIGGMGGISSHAVFNIARMCPASIVMYDDDIVETANMSGQFYSRDDVGQYKVDAILNTLEHYTTAQNIYARRERFTDRTEAGNIMICGFDNMTARRLFFGAWKSHVERLPAERRYKCLFIDGRLSLTVMQIFCFTGDDRYHINKYWEDYLFDDSQAEATVCSMKQTTYLASMIGAMITNMFTNFIANTLDPLIPYALPFFTEYDAQYAIFKTVN